MFKRKCKGPAGGGAGKQAGWNARAGARVPALLVAGLLMQIQGGAGAAAQTKNPNLKANATQQAREPAKTPPQVLEAQRFLTRRGWTPGRRMTPRANSLRRLSDGRSGAAAGEMAGCRQAIGAVAASNTWQPLGPTAVVTQNFGLVSGRVTSGALDPSDATGNRLYVGTTGGGVWMANNAAAGSTTAIVFTPLTDSLAALGGVTDASISIGAISVQPGGTGVILAGTGDPNDVLDSYYGAGILRSTDGGNTWSLIQQTSDEEDSLGFEDASFVGQGFAGFAWSTADPQLVVAAVSDAYEGTLVDAAWQLTTYEGLFYSIDSGATWHLATISDDGAVLQGPNNSLSTGGNAATAVMWNPIRQLFIAAVRYHGYYESADGVTWTRMDSQPGTGMSTDECPANRGRQGSIACPMYRGVLAVNPQTGDTFAWSVDRNDQDQGLWQDRCALSGGACSDQAITFDQQWNTAAFETSTLDGAATILDGSYNLALAAAPSQQDTLLLAGANDLWKCSLAMGCAWRNTTNSTTCMSAQVAEYQHALEWNRANPQEVFVGNDSGLWRSMDAIGETGSACSANDSAHFQNLNATLGSLSDVVSISQIVDTPYNLMAGLGVNGTAGVKGSSAAEDWPQILSGYGGPVAVDPATGSQWFVNTEPGVSIYQCSQPGPCTPSGFGTSPVVTNADVGGDGDTMPEAAPFLVDPLDNSQLLIGTCRVWRGPANGGGWSAKNAISPILATGTTGAGCNGNGLIRSMAALPLASGGEVIYVGTYGSASNGASLPGHVLKATLDPASNATPVWKDLTLNPVLNDSRGLNAYGLNISSVTIDSHDGTGNTVYLTVEGIESGSENVQTVYRSTNGGASWSSIMANLPDAPVNSLAIDPQSANTVYAATDVGVYFTTEASGCAQSLANCWSVLGSGLPEAPVVALSAAPTSASTPVLVAATYGRGIWQTPLWSSETKLTVATASPPNVAFPDQIFDTTSSPLTVTLEDTGSLPLAVTSISIGGSFSESDNCVNASVPAGETCTIHVAFTPQGSGPLTGEMTIFANVYGGQLMVDLTGTGTPAGVFTLAPSSLDFSQVEVGATSAPLQVTATNSSPAAIPISSVSITPPFVVSSNSCGTTSLAANSSCQLQVEFKAAQAGPASGLLTLTDGAGTQTVNLSGTGEAPPTDVLNPTSLAFQPTAVGQSSTALPVTITNSGGMALTSVSITASAQFRETNTCGTQLAAGSVCTISVVFAPTQTGAVSGILTIADAVQTQTVALSGTGLGAPVIAVSPSNLTFTNQQPGVPSAPQTLTVSNTGGSPLANIAFQITGAAAANYSIAATTCGATLGNGSNCTAQIVFTPCATGAIAATLAVSSSTSGVVPATVPLNGSGQLATGLATNPSQIAFQVVAAGQSSTAQAVTVTNSSGYDIGSVSLAANAPFSITQNACTGSLAAGANCTASVIFEPSAGGTSSGSLTVSSAAVATPATVALSGTGFDFTVGITGPASRTVASGQQASYTVVISPTGAGGTFIFACGTLPANALCQFNPPTETVSSGTQGNVEVQISTGSGSTVRLERLNPGSKGLWHGLPLACGLLLLPLAVSKRRKLWLVAVVLAVFAAGMSSCTSSGGGGTTGQGGGSSTPVGTYTIPVNVVSMGISHQVVVTLTID
jgi:hypothetical protein